MTARSIVQM